MEIAEKRFSIQDSIKERLYHANSRELVRRGGLGFAPGSATDSYLIVEHSVESRFVIGKRLLNSSQEFELSQQGRVMPALDRLIGLTY